MLLFLPIFSNNIILFILIIQIHYIEQTTYSSLWLTVLRISSIHMTTQQQQKTCVPSIRVNWENRLIFIAVLFFRASLCKFRITSCRCTSARSRYLDFEMWRTLPFIILVYTIRGDYLKEMNCLVFQTVGCTANVWERGSFFQVDN